MKKTIVLYNDNRKPDRAIATITGNKSFGETIFKRVSMKDRTGAIAVRHPSCSGFVTKINEKEYDGDAILMLYSNMVIMDEEAFGILLEKARFAHDCYEIRQGDETCGVIFPGLREYREQNPADLSLSIETEAFLNLAEPGTFRQYITGGFDARYFNQLSGDEYTVVKSSTNKEKIKKEYTFYGLLPEDMRRWFVLPYQYRENETEASYSMERYHMTDLAIRYVHGAISEDEFRSICDLLFRFISARAVKEVSIQEYLSNAADLYIRKVADRIERLKKCPQYPHLAAQIASGTPYEGIDEIFERYLKLYDRLMAGRSFVPVLVVGHGDLCFSNILYSHETSLIRFIDPKGALTQDELFMNPYYDLAKLSHSIFGSYDYFNSDLFEIVMDEKMQLQLKIDCENTEYKKIFSEYLKEYGLDLRLIRLFEASLFLSMLPLHIDREKKVLGFILNAIQIMDELEGLL